MEEIWKPVLGFESAYEASNLGRIRSIDRTVWRDDPRRSGGGCFYAVKGKILKPSVGHSKTNRYPMVMLSYTPHGQLLQRTYHLVHRLVWAAFNGQIPDDYQIDHVDDDYMNNNLDNLQCLSKPEHKKKTYSKKIGREWVTAGKMSSREIHAKFEEQYQEGYKAGYAQAQRDLNGF